MTVPVGPTRKDNRRTRAIRRPAQPQVSASRCRISAQLGRRQRPAGPLPGGLIVDGPDDWFAGQQIGQNFLGNAARIWPLPCAVRAWSTADGEGVEDALAAITDLERAPGDGCRRPEPPVPGGISGMPPARCPGLACRVARIPGDRVIAACPFSESAMAGRPARDHLLAPTTVRVLTSSLRLGPGSGTSRRSGTRASPHTCAGAACARGRRSAGLG
jgi:hypothetical protein